MGSARVELGGESEKLEANWGFGGCSRCLRQQELRQPYPLLTLMLRFLPPHHLT